MLVIEIFFDKKQANIQIKDSVISQKSETFYVQIPFHHHPDYILEKSNPEQFIILKDLLNLSDEFDNLINRVGSR